MKPATRAAGKATPAAARTTSRAGVRATEKTEKAGTLTLNIDVPELPKDIPLGPPALPQREYAIRSERDLELCKKDPAAYVNAAERLLMAIGEPKLVDTRTDPALSRIFSNKIILQSK